MRSLLESGGSYCSLATETLHLAMKLDRVIHGNRAREAAMPPAVTAAPMQILGVLEVFDPTTDSVVTYVERAELFLEVNSIPMDKKIPIFLNAVGKQHYQLVSNLLMADAPVSKTLPDIVIMLRGHYEPKLIVIS